ncbi:heparan-alpha-glucosaminide N-acetyltransferase-like isoform X1 [Polistes fuscatus]|uniref:heparan-alpha-glucosaminide N-acetyltransferase-like isoform X1 n=2 Tax=Polistes fuscatus TaxID=30207 RepID=UPI001CA80C4A|nr:heparan-alpha-glucosaminide N-acetyltransferase-like isoform X1 [Polistes fuscatus]XP_043495119.1 heparan-alpha-glucosaminide N-acetyltransferase-like isoform X1 [Polistes fuscatus]
MFEQPCFHSELKYDEACVKLKNKDGSNAWLYALSSDCVSCPYSRVSPISTVNYSVKFNTARSMKLAVLNVDGFSEYISEKNISNAICKLSPNLGEYGSYELLLRNDSCFFNTVIRPTNSYITLLIVFGIIVCFLIGISMSRQIWQLIQEKCMKRSDNQTTNDAAKKRRVKSIDTFRGISILFMIFVNNGAGGYYLLQHATWNGLLIGDLVFPCFMWIMGVCIPIAISSQLSRGISKIEISLNILKRSVMLFFIGVALNTLGSVSQLENIRIFGVLQRFGLAYLIVALMFLFLTPRKPKKIQNLLHQRLRDVSMLLPQWIMVVGIVVVHCLLTFKLSVPGCPTGYLGPGGRHEDGKYMNCTGGAAGYIDDLILTPKHIYQNLMIVSVYGSKPFDPEGILGCLTTIFQVFLGVQAGQILLCYKDWKDRVIRWLLWAVFLAIVGFLAHVYVIPVNKNLWSLSFALVTTAFALGLLSACYLLVDVARIWRGGPFRIPGMNALLMYIGHQLCYQIFPFHWRISNMHSRTLVLVEAIWSIVLWTCIAYIMHRKRIYITL